MKNMNNEDSRLDKSSDDSSTHERLCAYLLGEVSADEKRAMESELADSAELRALKQRLEATIGLVMQSSQVDETLPLEALSTLERISQPIPRITPWYLRSQARVAAGLLALTAGVLGGRALMEDQAGQPAASLPDSEQLARVDSSSKSSADLAPVSSKAGLERKRESSARQQEGASVGAVITGGLPSTEKAAVTPDGSVSVRNKVVDLSLGGGRDAGTSIAAPSSESAEGRFAGRYGSRKGAEGGPTTGPSSQGPSSQGPSSPGPSSPGPDSKKLGALGYGGGVFSEGPAGSSSTNSRRRGLLNEKSADALGSRLYFHDSTAELDFSLAGKQRGLSPEDFSALCEAQADRILQSCSRRTGERPADMFFRFWGDNPFELTHLDRQSTFGVDVDTASYTLARRYLHDGNLPSKEQIRTEEFVNYFKPDVAPPSEGTFAIETELALSRFGDAEDPSSRRWMMRVGVRGREVDKEERKPLALTFVVDTSGSMKDGRLQLVKHAIRLLVSQLYPSDSVAIVAFSKTATITLPMTSAQHRAQIEAAIYGLKAGGGTNAENGLRLGYEVAAEGLTPGAHNRVVFLSDGVANIGQTNQEQINDDVAQKRDQGIFLNTIGVGMSNHNDNFLEQLANKGDGVCNYVDSPVEARRALVDNFTGAFEAIARDVKIQVEFDPLQVERYRLLGYENRAIADADFRNDEVDAGEVGAGHQVVALYELELTDADSADPLATVRLRYKDPSGAERDSREDAATEISAEVYFSSATTWVGTSLGYRRAVLVAQFAEVLRQSVHARGDSLSELIEETVQLAKQMQDGDLVEFLSLLQTSRDLLSREVAHEDDLSRCIDEVRRNRILRAQCEELQEGAAQELLRDLESENKELEKRILELITKDLEQGQR